MKSILNRDHYYNSKQTQNPFIFEFNYKFWFIYIIFFINISIQINLHAPQLIL
jgi:hypothetical protein